MRFEIVGLGEMGGGLAQQALQIKGWVPVIAQSEIAFYRYRNPENTAGKAVVLLRHMYGGPPLHNKKEGDVE